MQYPLYVHQTDGMRYRGSFPDFPRADASGKSFAQLARNARDRVQRIYDRSQHLIPAPTDDLHALQMLDMDDGEGIWMFVEIDLARVTSCAVHLQFSLNEGVLRNLDEAAQERRMARTEFIALACLHELACEPDRVRGNGVRALFSTKVTGVT
ncbi:HicB family protein [Burkholderia sp. WAC0059]|uniref:type II toxin-antitoxin system HicB family antitoxin n=1 Tax=Burkholderia sp. WAC0059 TaxID=2066022 RepID=UPI000C7F0085|nr:type II toxin-antitoxin system HicB family antitoxin [Burkholderia sp. WAC0059]PLZ03558.1 HicB family protein [Burkholderia sp. WAC0059]